MKDSSIKPSPAPLLPPKSKSSLLKDKMAAKKMKVHKTPIMKVGKSKKISKNVDTKSKLNKDELVPTVKRKRGRPRNEDKLLVKKSAKEQKSAKKLEERKTVGRKRKLNVETKIEKDLLSATLKKPKISDSNCNINGDIKIPITSSNRQFIQKKEPSNDVDHCATNLTNSNGTLHGKKSLIFGNKKPPLTILKSATFHPTSKRELVNGNSAIPAFKFQTNKNKSVFHRDFGCNPFSNACDLNSNSERFNSVPSVTEETKDSVTNDFIKCNSKDFKVSPKDSVKYQPKEPVKVSSVKVQNKEFSRSQIKEQNKNQSKEIQKSNAKESLKSQVKDCVKTSMKDQAKSQQKESNKSNSKELVKISKLNSKETMKPLSNEQNKSQAKEASKSQPKDSGKLVPKEPVKPLFREPVKSHPQRMASLDAMAKMHVICTTDRKPPEPKHTTVAVFSQKPFSHQKSIMHERIQFDVKKETNEFKGNIVHKQEINFVKEKQQVFVSHSVEQSSIVEHEQSKTVSTKIQHEKEKKKKVKPSEKSMISLKKAIKSKAKQNPSSNMKLIEKSLKSEKGKSKISKNKDGEKKNAKVQNKVVPKTTKNVKEKPDVKSTCKKTKKVEQTKSEVKVKETIRMQKTCTYQSVTTMNSHGTASSSVVPVSHVGMTTNFSKTKKTVVTDEECKNKVNYSSGSVINNSYCLSTETSCSLGPHTDCCKFHAHPQIIPIAHVQTCSFGHSLNRSPDVPSSSHCDGGFPVYRFGHQQPVIFTPSTPDCGCCCPSGIVHDSCLLRKSIVAYSHHLPSPHHSHLPPPAYSSESMCSDCHPSNSALESQRHHPQHFMPSSSRSRVACSACCELHRESNHHHHNHHQSSLHYMSQPKTSSSLVPCEQSPLDLSLTSTTANVNVESDISLPQGHCPSPLCCRDLLLLRTSPRAFQQHTNLAPTKPCCKSCGSQSACETQAADPVQSLSCSNNKSIMKIGQSQNVDHVTLLSSPVSQGSVIHPVASTSGVTNKNVPHVVTDDSLLTAKQEKSISPKQSSKLSVVLKKRVFAHGWSWKGKPREKLIALTNDSVPCPRVCYPSVQHKEGDTINERDCVLLRSGPKDTDLPYVAKVAAFWENPDDGEMMMSLLWYYRPEHTDQGRKPGQMEDEVFASRHKDVNSVACIEDKCYVLTFNEYCRYKASLSMEDDMIALSTAVVPQLSEGYPRRNRLPSEPVSQDIVFFCRHVYDFRQKRILKNPT